MTARRRDALAALRHRDFLLYQIARVASVLATQALSVAIAWQVYETTRDPLALGFVGLAQFLPGLVLALPAGQVADRLDRRHVVSACLLASMAVALVLVGLTLRGAPSTLVVYGLLVAFGSARGFWGPAGQALMPDLVPSEDFPNAVAWSSSAWQVAMMVGPALGGGLYAIAGPVGAYVAAAATFALGLAASLAIRTRPARAEASALSWSSTLEGVRFVFRQRVLLGAISLDLFAVLLGGATALLPVFARDILHAGPTGLGVLRAAPGVGAAAMALLLAARPLGGGAGRTLFACVALFGVATVVFGLSTSFPLSLAALLVLGAADLVSVYVRHTVVQAATPAGMRGRVSAVNVVFIGASNELGEFESGVTAAWLGAVPAVVVGGLGTLAVVGLWALLFPELRRVDRLDATPAA